MPVKQLLDLYVRARYPLIWLVTPEERRAVDELVALAGEHRKRIMLWSGTVGLVNPALPDREDSSKRDPLTLLKTILEDNEPCLWVLRDFHPFLKDANVVRRLREVAFRLEHSNKTVILLGPVLKIPPELEKEITVVDFDLPTADQLQGMLDSIVETLQRSGAGTVNLDKRQRARLFLDVFRLASSRFDLRSVRRQGRPSEVAVEFAQVADRLGGQPLLILRCNTSQT